MSSFDPQPVPCIEGCGRMVVPYTPHARHEITGWASLKGPRSASRRGGGLNTLENWHETGRVRCEHCARHVRETGNALQEELL